MPTDRTARRVLALLLAAVLGGGAGLRAPEPCPHHAGSSEGVHGVAVGSEDARSRGHSGHAEAGDVGDDPCTCVGTCHATAAAPLPASGGFTGPTLSESPVSGASRAPRTIFPGQDAYLIPFANGPPASLSG